jgi:hypothetical protein
MAGDVKKCDICKEIRTIQAIANILKKSFCCYKDRLLEEQNGHKGQSSGDNFSPSTFL